MESARRNSLIKAATPIVTCFVHAPATAQQDEATALDI
jgi:hypothetical protein